MKYGLLHYPGNLTARIRVGQLLGHDETYRPFAVTEAEYDSIIDLTTVWLQTATGEQIKAAQS